MLQAAHGSKKRSRPIVGRRSGSARSRRLLSCLLLAAPLAMAVAGCGGASMTADPSGALTVTPGTASIDTNCTGCNTSDSSGNVYEQFSAKLSNGAAANVTWSVSGGDPRTGPGAIGSTNGQYAPPNYLSADSVQVTVTAALVSDPASKASATITVTPGFLQPLSPENVALGANGTVTVTGAIAEADPAGDTSINYSVASSYNGSGSTQNLQPQSCARPATGPTTCTVTYKAPASITSSAAATYIVGTVGTSSSKSSTEVLLNSAGVNSSPITNQTQQNTPIALGTSGGNKLDLSSSSSGTECSSGTLGALLTGSGGDYILSNNHVLARSDQATIGEDITQPGLVDDNCDPNKGALVATLTGFLPLSSSSTNADAAIASVNNGAVNPSGAILGLGPLVNGALQPAPPGISSSGGMGESPAVGMTVAKSGRTTGLTCGSISAIDASVEVSYYKDCCGTQPYLTKTYSNQVEITGNQFTDAGDSGSLVVDTSNAEPVGLFFAGGVDSSGQSQSVASPAPDVLDELDANPTTKTYGPFTFTGAADHQVSCLNYGAGAISMAQARSLSDMQIARAQSALASARQLVNSSLGVLGVATGKSSDDPGSAAVLIYVTPTSTAAIPATIDGVRTAVIPTTAGAVATGSAPLTPFSAGAAPALSAAALHRAAAIKQSLAAALMQQNPAFFGVAIGQSYDDPAQAALVIYVDQNNVPATLPATIGSLRTRYIIMSRLHVTRALRLRMRDR